MRIVRSDLERSICQIALGAALPVSIVSLLLDLVNIHWQVKSDRVINTDNYGTLLNDSAMHSLTLDNQRP